MSATLVRLSGALLLILGVVLSAYIITQIPPYQSGGSLDLLAVALLYVGLLLGLWGLGTLIALWLHRRWPALAGSIEKKGSKKNRARPATALRQGFLSSFSLCAIALFSMLHILDSIFVFVIILISGLLETYFQSLERKT